MKNLPIALRMLRRNAHAGEARVLAAALFVAVAAVTTVGFFADRVRGALDQQANELLGGDLVVIADHPVPGPFRERAAAEGLALATTTTFPSMVSGSAGTSLAEIKAVSGSFPLRGRLRVAGPAEGADREVEGAPAPGTVWVGGPLVSRIGAARGQAIRVGNATLAVAEVITREPDSVLDYFGIAPRVLMNEADLAATGLVQVGSRVTWRLLVAGDAKAVARYDEAMRPLLARGERIEGVRDSRSEVRVSLERAQRFLGLASLLSVVLASVAVALAARRFSIRQTDGAAMMRCLGAAQADIFAINAWQFVLLAAAGCAAGTAAGYGAQAVLAQWLTGFFSVALPAPGWRPAVQGAVIGMVLVLGFTLPPLLRLRNVPTLRVLRSDVAVAEPSSLVAYALGLGTLSALIVWQAGDLKLGAMSLGGFAAALGVAAAAGYALIRGLARLRAGASGPWRYGLANLRRRTGSSLVQVMALGVGIMAMLLLTLVRTDLIVKWQKSMPADMPNRFAINIQGDQLPLVKAYFAELGLATPDLYPMVRGRLVAIGDRPVSPASYEDQRARRLVEREFNLSWARELRPDNRIVAGSWWDPRADDPQFSVEEGIAKTLSIRVGDTLAWDVGGTRFSARVTSLRKVEWDSFKANFFVIANPGLLERYPASWITSFHLPSGREEVVNRLVERFPNVSVIDLTAIMGQVKRISDQVSRAVEFVFLFAIAAGLVVLFAAITSTQDERVFEGAVMRTLGASRRQMVLTQLSEFLAIGLLAGMVAAAGAVGLALVLSERVLGVPYEFNWVVPVAGLLAGGAGVAIAGLLGTRRAVDSPPLAAIRALG
ncbi:MAG: FtsX-like permease family protein [Betaproteobacteria bacterium]|nr:FtsX-like permease family protein [Betaproteobacteria bacterium]